MSPSPGVEMEVTAGTSSHAPHPTNVLRCLAGGLAQERGLGPGFGIAKRTRPAVSPAAPRDRAGAASPSDIASPACRPKTPRGGAHSPCSPTLIEARLTLMSQLGVEGVARLESAPRSANDARPEGHAQRSALIACCHEEGAGSAPWLTPWLTLWLTPWLGPVAHPEARPRGSPRGSAPWLTPWLCPVAHPVARPVARAPCCPRRWSLCTGLALCECNGQGRRNRADLPARQLRQ
ncbi:unnamed protein product [Lampetra planeri]